MRKQASEGDQTAKELIRRDKESRRRTVEKTKRKRAEAAQKHKASRPKSKVDLAMSKYGPSALHHMHEYRDTTMYSASAEDATLPTPAIEASSSAEQEPDSITIENSGAREKGDEAGDEDTLSRGLQSVAVTESPTLSSLRVSAAREHSSLGERIESLKARKAALAQDNARAVETLTKIARAAVETDLELGSLMFPGV